ncbi:MAG: hypothetical protein M3Q75_01410 [Gemmatimonadota bacterium]|nr:hypothetical protein [Gemmatimonadota bacterium]
MSGISKVGRIVFLLTLTATATPILAQTAGERVDIEGDDDGFDNWGLLGLLGLAGLLGRNRRDKVNDTRRPLT